MRCQVLSSGSRGNSTLVRMGETSILVDAGLTPRQMRERITAAGISFKGLDHILVTHGHLDHARSAGVIAKQHDATVHCPNSLLRARSVVRAPRLAAIHIGETTSLEGQGEPMTYLPVLLPHDCDPPVAYRIEYGDRSLGILTDMGRPDDKVAASLHGVNVLILEFNHDEEMLEAGPYPAPLKKRILGDRGHLSNAQAARMLEQLAGPDLHTVVLAHLSAHNNTPDLARRAAEETLARLGRTDVRVEIASQDEVGESMTV